MPPHYDPALAVKSNGAWPAADFDSLPRMQRRVPLYSHWHNQTRCDRCQDGWGAGMYLDHQTALVWRTVEGQVPRQGHEANLRWQTLCDDHHTNPGDIPDGPCGNILVVAYHRIHQGQVCHLTVDLHVQTWTLHNRLWRADRTARHDTGSQTGEGALEHVGKDIVGASRQREQRHRTARLGQGTIGAITTQADDTIDPQCAHLCCRPYGVLRRRLNQHIQLSHCRRQFEII